MTRTECETFSRSGDAVFELSTRFAEPFLTDSKLSEEEQLNVKKLMFYELTQVALWGNATDLSLLIDVSVTSSKADNRALAHGNLASQMSEDDIKNLQSTGGDHLAATEKNILSNDLPKVWDLLSSKKKGCRIDIVMDNAGFELFCDMIYADFLIVSGLASEVRFHGKKFAWFVSDVTAPDFSWIINQMIRE